MQPEQTTQSIKFIRNQKVLITVGIILFVLLVVAVIVLLGLNKPKSSNNNSGTVSSTQSTSFTPSSVSSSASQSSARWNSNQNFEWEVSGTPPNCPDPLTLMAPADLSLATSILYPGQTRGTDYKPHGGIRFDNVAGNSVDVVAPMDAVVVSGVRFIMEGEIQYGFDFINSCGIKYRLGHFRELSPKLQAIADKFPEATTNSGFTFVNPPVEISEGELLATKVGLIGQNNVFFDWGVYDLRGKNDIAKSDPTYTQNHPGEHASYAVCWFDLLSAADEQLVRALPAGDGVNGKNSDYCD